MGPISGFAVPCSGGDIQTEGMLFEARYFYQSHRRQRIKARARPGSVFGSGLVCFVGVLSGRLRAVPPPGFFTLSPLALGVAPWRIQVHI